MAVGFNLGSSAPDKEPTYAELKARVAELEREVKQLRDARQRRLLRSARTRSRKAHSWMTR